MRIFFILFAICVCSSVHAQSKYVQFGGIATFYQYAGTGLGGEATINFQSKSNLVLGGGLACLAFARPDDNGPYIPFFGRVGYAIPVKSIVITAHGDAGYGLLIQQEQLLGANIDRQGGFYASPGISLHVNNHFSPFLDARYSFYGFKTTFDHTTTHFYNRGITLSVGFCLLNKRQHK